MLSHASRLGFRSSLFTVCVLTLASLGAATAEVLAPTRPESVGLSTERLARLDSGMQAEIDAGRKAGIVAMIVRRGQIAHLKAYGMAERESNTKMTTEQLFRLYSMTKPVTSVALLMLYEEGKFQLGDPLDKHIPAFKDLKVYAGTDASGKMLLEDPRRKPTIHDVFRHTAGFTYGVFGGTPVDQLYQSNGVDFGKLGSLKELVEEKLPKVPLLYHPGDQWVYSVAHDVQAYLVEHFSGMPFDEFVRERIIEPLGMTDAVFGVPKQYVARYTANYMSTPDGKLQQIETREGVAPRGSQSSMFGGYARYTQIPFGGLSLSSTAMDYARFAQMLLNGGELDGVRLLSPKTVELMASNTLPRNIAQISVGPPDPNAPSTGYGLGVSVLLEPALAGNVGSKGTFGWAGAASTWVNIDPEEQMVTIVMAQDMNFDTGFAGRFQTLAYQAIVD
jgi:CubicO group peptidase (beta-lactamase class C family)